MFLTVLRIAEAVSEEDTSGLSSSVWSDVKVPGNTTKPARRIHVKNAAKMLCILGIVSMASSIFMYLVCTLFWRLRPPFGRDGALV